jgi:hypothetical protein
MFNDKTLFNNSGVKKERKRGKGVSKPIKKIHVDNKELREELTKFRHTVLEQRANKEQKLKALKTDLSKLEKNYKTYKKLIRPRKEVIEKYLNDIRSLNEQLEQVRDQECNGQASERLGELFLQLVDNFATKTNFSNYPYLEEMKSRAIFFLLKYSHSYDINKLNSVGQIPSAFCYCTQIVHNAFRQVIKKEKKKLASKKEFIDDYFQNNHFNRKSENLMG